MTLPETLVVTPTDDDWNKAKKEEWTDGETCLLAQSLRILFAGEPVTPWVNEGGDVDIMDKYKGNVFAHYEGETEEDRAKLVHIVEIFDNDPEDPLLEHYMGMRITLRKT